MALKRTGTRALLLLVVTAAVAAVAALAGRGHATAATAPDSSGLWQLGFETGSLSQWNWNLESGSNPSAQFQLVSSPSRDGGLAGQFTVRPGDAYGGSGGERSELALINSGESEGQSYYYGWSTYFPTGWTAPQGWGDIVQWHTKFPLPAVLAVNARGSDVYLELYSGLTTIASRVLRSWRISGAEQGVWHDYVIYVRWSLGNGAIQLWQRIAGQNAYERVVSVSGIPTLQTDGTTVSSNYLKMGLYRNTSSYTNTIVHDSMRRALSLSQVLQAGPQPPTGSAWTQIASEDAQVSGASAGPAPAPPPPTTTTGGGTTTPGTTTGSGTPTTASGGGDGTPTAAPGTAGYANGFESGSGGWSSNGPSSFTVDGTGGRGGSNALRIDSTQPGGTLSRWMSSPGTVPATPGATYSVSAWLRTQGATSGYGTLDVTYFTAAGQYIAGSAQSSNTYVSGTNGWTQASASTTAPAGAATMRIEARLFGPGTLWLDDVAVANG